MKLSNVILQNILGKDLQLTLAIIKPHVIKAPHAIQDIRAIIRNNNFYILQTKRLLLRREEAENFYAEHREKFFFWRLVSFMCSGCIDAHILARENAIQQWRQLMGPTKVFQAQFSAPDSIRGLHGLTDTRNAAHGSDSKESAAREIKIFFPHLNTEDLEHTGRRAIESGLLSFDEKLYNSNNMQKSLNEDESFLTDMSDMAASQTSLQKGISKTGIVLLGLSGGAAIGLSAICLPFVTPALRRICLPYVPATEQQLCNVVQALKAPAALGQSTVGAPVWRQRPGGRLLVDLGSGDGRVVERTSMEGVTSVGVELNAWLVLYSRVRALWTKVSPRPHFKRANLWDFSLQEFSDVVIFGVQPMMSELEVKFGQELLEGSRVVACRFSLPTWRPIATFGSGVDTVWLYHVGKSKQAGS